MTTKGPSRKQIIVPMGSDNIKTFMTLSNDHVINVNQALKNVKSDVIIDFIHLDHRGLIFVLNKVAAPSDICVVSNYVKNANNMNSEDVQDARLPQSKSYLKILGLPYHIKNIIKSTHIFNDIKVVSKPQVCPSPIWLLCGLIFGTLKTDLWLRESLIKASM